MHHIQYVLVCSIILPLYVKKMTPSERLVKTSSPVAKAKLLLPKFSLSAYHPSVSSRALHQNIVHIIRHVAISLFAHLSFYVLDSAFPVLPPALPAPPHPPRSAHFAELMARASDAATALTPAAAPAAPAATPAKARYEVFPVLDGVRVLMTLWVVTFHVLWHTSMILKEPAFDAFYYAPWMRFLNNGLFAVDIFFILTGFLLAYPVLAGARTGTWSEFVWLRVTRVYPTLIVSVLFVCLGLFYRSPLLAWDRHPSTGIREMVETVAGRTDLTGVPSNCEISIANLLFLNNIIPFGGCMGWTWSLCVQVHFYLIFPLAIRWFGRGTRLVKAILAGLCLHGLLRFVLYTYAMMPFAPPKVYVFELVDKDSFFMYFNVWYSSTPQRLGCIFTGVLLAWVQINLRQLPAQLAAAGSKRLLHWAALAVTVLGVAGTFYTDWLSPLHMTFFSVGGLLWLFALNYIIYLLINPSVSPVFGALSRVLSHKIFGYLQIPTYAVYLTHSAFAMKIWDMYIDRYGMLTEMTWGIFIPVALTVIAVSFLYGTLCYHLVEVPFKNWLRPRTTAAKTVSTTAGTGESATATATVSTTGTEGVITDMARVDFSPSKASAKGKTAAKKAD